MNFTLRHMDVSCDAYNYFRRCLSRLQDLVDGQCSYTVERLPSDFPQFFQYERIEHLVRGTHCDIVKATITMFINTTYGWMECREIISFVGSIKYFKLRNV